MFNVIFSKSSDPLRIIVKWSRVKLTFLTHSRSQSLNDLSFSIGNCSWKTCIDSVKFSSIGGSVSGLFTSASITTLVRFITKLDKLYEASNWIFAK